MGLPLPTYRDEIVHKGLSIDVRGVHREDSLWLVVKAIKDAEYYEDAGDPWEESYTTGRIEVKYTGHEDTWQHLRGLICHIENNKDTNLVVMRPHLLNWEWEMAEMKPTVDMLVQENINIEDPVVLLYEYVEE